MKLFSTNRVFLFNLISIILNKLLGLINVQFINISDNKNTQINTFYLKKGPPNLTNLKKTPINYSFLIKGYKTSVYHYNYSLYCPLFVLFGTMSCIT